MICLGAKAFSNARLRPKPDIISEVAGMFIAELALRLIGDVLFYSTGRLTLLTLSLGRVRPKTLKQLWLVKSERELAIQIYYEIVAVQFLGTVVSATIAIVVVLLYQKA